MNETVLAFDGAVFEYTVSPHEHVMVVPLKAFPYVTSISANSTVTLSDCASAVIGTVTVFVSPSYVTDTTQFPIERTVNVCGFDVAV